jgi:hypothetical protein
MLETLMAVIVFLFSIINIQAANIKVPGIVINNGYGSTVACGSTMWIIVIL